MTVTYEQYRKILESPVYKAARIWGVEPYSNILRYAEVVAESIESVEVNSTTDMLDLAFNATKAVHTEWIKCNLHKFERMNLEGDYYRFLPCELAGFDEFVWDAVFVRPVFEFLFDFSFKFEDLRAKYEDAVTRYQSLHDVDLSSLDDVARWLHGPIMKTLFPPEVCELVMDPDNIPTLTGVIQEIFIMPHCLYEED